MKITFFKNETHFHPRVSYTFENAKIVNFDCGIHKFRKYSQCLFLFPLLVFVYCFFEDVTSNYMFIIVSAFICLPVHELCHALFCWVSGRRVERICFFPYKNFLTSPTAYVKPSFGVWNKIQSTLFSLFPLLLLSIIPAILAIFILAIRFELLFISLLNLAMSCFDIVDILYLAKTPRKSLHFGDFILNIEKSAEPIIIHQLSVTPKLDKISHKCFQYRDNSWTEIDQAPESLEVNRLREEFVKQFNVES